MGDDGKEQRRGHRRGRKATGPKVPVVRSPQWVIVQSGLARHYGRMTVG